jgi:hypothetical protein
MQFSRFHLIWIIPIGLGIFLLFSTWVILKTAPIPKKDLPYSELVSQLRTKPSLGLWLRAKIIRKIGSGLPRGVKVPPLTSSDIRGLAAEYLSAHGEAAVKPLLSALEDPSLGVRLRSARALGDLGSTAIDAADPIGKLISDPNLIGSPRKISNIFNPTTGQDRFRIALSKALGRIAPEDPRTVLVILEGVERNARPDVSDLITGLMPEGQDPNKATLKLLAGLISGASSAIGFQLIRKFEEFERRLGDRSFDIWEDPVIEAVAEKLDSSDPVFRAVSAQWMASRADPSNALKERVSTLLFDSHPEVSRAALHCIEAESLNLELWVIGS